MKKGSFVAAMMMVFCVICIGCKMGDETNSMAKSTNTYAVVVGMEKSQFAGECPGAGYDADRMYKLLEQYTAGLVLLRDNNATKANVVDALTRAIENAGNGLVVFYYSGHGGSEPFPDTGIEETDGKDEFLCLWDTWLRDNDIWKMIQKCKGRFFMISDSCHSQTQFRSPTFRLKPLLAWDTTLNENHQFSLLCWSGCPDNTYSYGASTGGQFTNALLRHFNSKKTYEYLWDEIKNDKTLRAYENPQSTAIGNGFVGKSIFR